MSRHLTDGAAKPQTDRKTFRQKDLEFQVYTSGKIKLATGSSAHQ
jgi:hypothetical protein